jgi:hypothetical protein
MISPIEFLLGVFCFAIAFLATTFIVKRIKFFEKLSDGESYFVYFLSIISVFVIILTIAIFLILFITGIPVNINLAMR